MRRRFRVPVVDLALAGLCLLLALAELVVWDEWSTESRFLQAAGAVAIGSALALRRTAPLVAAALCLAGAVVLAAGGDPPQLLAAGLVGILLSYTIAAELDGSRLLAAAAMIGFAVVVRDVADPALNGFDIAIDGLYFAAPFAIGRVVRRRQKRVELVAEVAADLERDAVRRERERIARELHDVIAHGMSVMVVQADAARHGLAPGDEETRAALVEIERTGRESLREMRRLLGLLRDDDDSAALAPQPGLAGVDALAQSVRQAGLPVELRIVGEARPLSPGTDVAAYRILQEALTNALRHAGPARATVEIAYGPHDLALRVEDTGRPGDGAVANGGHGLVGMRERVRLYGGSLEVGPGPRGFVVSARLPLEAST